MKNEISEEKVLSMLNTLGVSMSDINTLYPRIMEPLAKPSELNLTAREFFYWCDKGIIDIPKSKEGQSPWSRLTLLDVIWIRIVKELRRFNFPFSSIVKIKEDLFQNIFLKIVDLNDSQLESIIKDFKDDSLKDTFNILIKQAKKDPDTIKKQFGPLACPMGSLLADILIFNRKIHMHICKIGDDFPIIFEGYSLQHTSQETLDAVKDQTHLTLCINELVAEYLLDVQCERINIEFGLISVKEIEILEAIRNKEVTEITIKKDHDEKLVFTTTKRSELKNENIETLKRILRMNEFDDVRVVLRNDKHIYLENKTRKKL
jgi:hypothetical protein